MGQIQPKLEVTLKMSYFDDETGEEIVDVQNYVIHNWQVDMSCPVSIVRNPVGDFKKLVPLKETTFILRGVLEKAPSELTQFDYPKEG